MKTTKTIALSILALLLTCSTVSAAKLQTTVSIAPLKYFVEKIGGEKVKANIMVKPGSSPATYEPQPRQMALLSKSEIYFAIGVPFERAWIPRFRSANDKLEIINLGKTVVHQTMKTHVHDEDEHKHHNEHETTQITDPHVWLSPPLVRIISQQIRDVLIEHDPANTEAYTSNYLNFAAEINKLDSELLNIFTPKGERFSFMVYHPSWGYFARTYGLNQIPIELEGKEPSPKELTQLIKFAKKNSVKAIFIQPQFSQKSARAIASSIGAETLTADPLAEDWAENLRRTAATFIKER
ncbi:metal ABC transporter solute-binding protein, Zn/Mn family [Desulfovibrio sp. JC022]|uniref:metal ABC transporter solute-binding protein, Zn/Mn family n=1 Tax=Desulfovibrio sp. JC022 TaxID=2593642 RepID=UPI0013CFE394|nr:zinc ABC transporter substrate-binding protein [Desulfovibrio sp. JC022]NDV22392.1 cation ABC transporter substrate-binding protein [Desulfovibrio sp. JC022]